MGFGFTISTAQAETLSCLTESFGTVHIDGLGNPGREGPILMRSEGQDEEVLILANGDVVRHTCENAVAECAEEAA